LLLDFHGLLLRLCIGFHLAFYGLFISSIADKKPVFEPRVMG
jgi:hypothetical protein